MHYEMPLHPLASERFCIADPLRYSNQRLFIMNRRLLISLGGRVRRCCNCYGAAAALLAIARWRQQASCDIKTKWSKESD